MNKQGEGKASNLIIVSLLILTMLTMFSSLTISLAGSYNKNELPEFAQYSDIYSDSINNSNEFITSTNTNSSDSQTLTERFEDNIFRRGLKTILKYPKMMGYATKSITRSFQNFPFELPTEIKVFMTILLGMTIVVLVLKAYWRYDKI